MFFSTLSGVTALSFVDTQPSVARIYRLAAAEVKRNRWLRILPASRCGDILSMPVRNRG
jgi:hypothetical protein